MLVTLPYGDASASLKGLLILQLAPVEYGGPKIEVMVFVLCWSLTQSFLSLKRGFTAHSNKA